MSWLRTMTLALANRSRGGRSIVNFAQDVSRKIEEQEKSKRERGYADPKKKRKRKQVQLSRRKNRKR